MKRKLKRRRNKRRRERKFNGMIEKYLESDAVMQMDTITQHRTTTTLEHCKKVAWISYLVNERLHLNADEQELVESAMLHDFYLYDWRDGETTRREHGFGHPYVASENAAKYFDVSEKIQANIKSHMWPMNITEVPKSKEGILLCCVDKYCALVELFRSRQKSGQSEEAEPVAVSSEPSLVLPTEPEAEGQPEAGAEVQTKVQSEPTEFRWAILGTGVIANEMAVAFQKAGRTPYAVWNRTPEKATAFAETYGIQKVYSQEEALFSDPAVDVVYIATPNTTHFDFLKQAIQHGKHVLVEKPITLDSAELTEVLALAKEHRVVVGEAMTIYHMPIYRTLKERLTEGQLGKLHCITMNFGSMKEYDPQNRFFNPALAGGAMLDIGVYALSFLRYFFSEQPNRLLSQVKKAPTGVEEQVGLLLQNEAEEMASVMLSLRSKQPKRGMISCEKGYIELMEYPRACEAVITYTETGETEVLTEGDCADALLYELQDMERAIQGDPACMCLSYTRDVMELVTGFRSAWESCDPEKD